MLLKFKEWFPKVGKDSWIAPSADVIGNVTIGEDSSIWFGTVIRGDVHKIEIGDQRLISRDTIPIATRPNDEIYDPTY